MAYTNHFDGEALNNHYTNDKYRGLSGEPVSLGPWNMDRGRSYSDTQSSPAADHHTRTSATSTASLRSNNQTHRPKLKHITCHYWATEEGCKKTDEDCYYAHKETTFGVAQKPVQVEPGKPAVAGRNASNPRPVYTNWQQVHSRSAIPNRGPEVQQQVNHIEAKAIQNYPPTEFEAYHRNSNTMHPPESNSAPESVNNLHTNLDMHSTQPAMSRQPTELQPSVGHFASRGNGAFNQPFGKDPTNYNPATHHGAAAPAHQPTQQTSPGNHQGHCPHPIDHIRFENLQYEQMKMILVKDQAIYRLASAIDLATQTMEESQMSNERDIQKLIDVASDLARTQGGDESPYRGGGKLFNSNGSYQLNTHPPALASKRKNTGNYMVRYETNHDLPYELTSIAEKLVQTYKTVENNITCLRNAKQTLGIAFENVGEKDVLPKGWIQQCSPK